MINNLFYWIIGFFLITIYGVGLIWEVFFRKKRKE